MPANEHLKSFDATDADAFKSVARAWAATVTVCVVKRKAEFVSDEKPEIDGFTATSFQTVSINPPIVLELHDEPVEHRAREHCGRVCSTVA
jgi:flavin reductase (DIM6/NTAB) family NADH-FMN oxidoreductase RutF